MKYSIYDHTQNIRELQIFLRTYHENYGGLLVNPDGIFDEVTREALRRFQEENDLAVTETGDFPTWTLLQELHLANAGKSVETR